jgi:hypothetical protein
VSGHPDEVLGYADCSAPLGRPVHFADLIGRGSIVASKVATPRTHTRPAPVAISPPPPCIPRGMFTGALSFGSIVVIEHVVPGGRSGDLVRHRRSVVVGRTFARDRLDFGTTPLSDPSVHIAVVVSSRRRIGPRRARPFT